MDPRRLSTGEWIAAMSGLALLVSLFLPWYSASGRHITAWQAMSVDDVLLALAAIGAIAAAAATAARPGTPVPVAYASLGAFAGIFAVVLTVWRVVDPAPSANVSLGAGAWAGLAAALAMSGGALAGMRDEGPARRSAEAARSAADAARERAETVSLSPQGGIHS